MTDMRQELELTKARLEQMEHRHQNELNMKDAALAEARSIAKDVVDGLQLKITELEQRVSEDAAAKQKLGEMTLQIKQLTESRDQQISLLGMQKGKVELLEQ